MVDILLVQPPIRDYYFTAKRTIPYGLATIAAVLETEGFSVEILDALATSRSKIIEPPPEMAYLETYYGRGDLSPFALYHKFRHYGCSFGNLAERARRSGAFLVGISALFTPYAGEALTAAESIKSALPSAFVVLGGHHPTQMPAEVMRCPAVDFVIRGEGEAALPHLAAVLRYGGSLDSVPGLVRRTGAGTLSIREPAALADLDHLPLPAMHLIERRFYRRAQKGSTAVVTSRGCPLRCSYCSVGHWANRPHVRRNVESVLAEIERAVVRDGVGFIDFEDENLSLDRTWFLRLLKTIHRRFGGGDIELRAMNGLFPPSLDEEVVAAMAAAGFKNLNLALGSSSQRQLRRFHRPDVRGAFDATLSAAVRHGLSTVGYVIAAAPDQSAAESVADLLYLAERRTLVGLSIFYPSPGSPDYTDCRTRGLLPSGAALLRSSALPICHTTNRLQAVTLLRLSRVLNFSKHLLDLGMNLPDPLACPSGGIPDPRDRMAVGIRLLQWFLHDGRIRGLDPATGMYEHRIDHDLTCMFLSGLNRIQLHGATEN